MPSIAIGPQINTRSVAELTDALKYADYEQMTAVSDVRRPLTSKPRLQQRNCRSVSRLTHKDSFIYENLLFITKVA